jgi:biotin-dependent carboxylase-like uncharacterized protein
MKIFVVQPGLLTTVQDLGRHGFQRFGVPVSGCVDPRSAIIANILVGNPDNAAVLECTLSGPTLQLEHDSVIAITGANLSPTLDGENVPLYQAIFARAGQTIRFGPVQYGCRAYLAFAGGIDVPEVMQSRSTFLRAEIGGFQGRKLRAGDQLLLKKGGSLPSHLEKRSLWPEYQPQEIFSLRVVMGPQEGVFTSQGTGTFLGDIYTVSNQFDRMGCRLLGGYIEHRGSCDIISDGIAFGAVQVPASGQPIIMLADRQTTGGYTKIAAVISADFRLLGQLKMSDRIRFEQTTIQEAQEAFIAQRKALHWLRHSLND